jgi:hypothetical protein
LDQLKPFLQVLEQKANMEIWSDQNINQSDDWEGEIQKALFNADAAILLISQNFLGSDYINNVELPALLRSEKEKGLRIFPFQVRML